MTRGRMSRRTLLRGAGGAALSLPVLDAMLPLTGFGKNRALAQQMAPRRVLIFHWGNGIPEQLWAQAKAHFDPIREKALFISGVPIVAGADGSLAAHGAGAQPLLTGSGNAASSEWADSDSVDVLLEPVGLAAGLPFGAYRAQAFTQALTQPDPQARRVCIKNQQPIPMQDDPSQMYQDLFAGRNLGVAADEPAAAPPSSGRAPRVLDATLAKVQALSSKLDATSRQQLEAYTESLREVERRLEATGGTASASCADPGATNLGAARTSDEVQAVAEAQASMMAMAFACDLTRVGAFQVTGAGGGSPSTDCNYGSLLGNSPHPDGHHMLTHNYESSDSYLPYIEEVIDYIFGLAASLAIQLDSFAEGDGTVLDHTAIYMVTETAGSKDAGNIHRQNGHDMRALIVGGTDYFNLGGRELQFNGGSGRRNGSGGPTNPDAIAVNDSNPTNNRMLLHLLRYMGDNRSSIGVNPDYSAGGPLTGLT